MQYAYLGVATIKFFVYDPNTTDYIQVHQLKYSNVSSTQTNLGNPNMKIGWTSASLGSSGTNLTVRGASLYLGIEGKYVIKIQRPFNVDCQDGALGRKSKEILQLNDLIGSKKFQKIIKYSQKDTKK